MDNILYEFNQFMQDCDLAYAVCGGYALELFTNTKYRPHSDIDITLFAEDRINIINYILSKDWDVYEYLHHKNCLKQITDTSDKGILNCLYIWAIKPNCSFFRIKPRTGEKNYYDFEILDQEQKEFDFIEIIFNEQKDGKFICDNEKNIARILDKAILHHNTIPYLAPEIILYFISNPAYIESDYHRGKTQIDFSFVPKFLSKESLDWLITAIEKAYPKNNMHIEQLKELQCTL